MSPPFAPGASGAQVGAQSVWGLAASHPMLARFNAAGVLAAADVHVARRLGALCGERDERVLLAVALAVCAVRTGSVCTRLEDAAALSEAASAAADEDGEQEVIPPVTTGDPTTHPTGDVVADLAWPPAEEWREAVIGSAMVAVGPDGDPGRPVRWVDGRIYLDRYWRLEQVVRTEVDERLAGPIDLAQGEDAASLAEAVGRLFPKPGDTRQRLAAATAALSRITVLTGGPGTGKTTTVARLVATVQAVAGPGLRVALAAPTGKAATRLQEAVNSEVATLADEDRERVGRLRASTLHRLLGSRPQSRTRFRHDAAHRLPHDLVVVDESSMVSLPLMARLLEALRPHARLVLVGDPDQLASVEAGAVLGDLVARPAAAAWLPESLRAILPAVVPVGPAGDLSGDVSGDLSRDVSGDLSGDVSGDPAGDVPADLDHRLSATEVAALGNGVVRLSRPHRYGGTLSRLAEAIRRADAEGVIDVLRAPDPAVEFIETDDGPVGEVPSLRKEIEARGRALTEAAIAGDATAALTALAEHRLLLAHRQGPAGVARWAALAASWVAAATGTDPGLGLPPGLPVIVTQNDAATGLSNGDTGVVIRDTAGPDGTFVAFGEPGAPRLVRPHRLPEVQPVHAMTIHRAQGSQFARVSVVLPPSSSPLLTRELFYTAVTRAQEGVRVVGSLDAVRLAVQRPIRRASGLRHRT